ncbi:hypothetical protein [Psychroflexus maritimus]|uniref:Uncharacterized protein n=1 Tax=Psychroflexus maritimus TaxID=2714865 RepID=A0A967AC66_9FLAO|nr:hypothetical protein [Psychroflexus maritimus]NGZ89552.1 hypothetical protein [Psychroflexus maritimus]
MAKKNFKNTSYHQKRYWFFGGAGTALLGFGLSALVESGFLKHQTSQDWQWILAGTLSLILIMTGINFLFESYSHKQLLKDKENE